MKEFVIGIAILASHVCSATALEEHDWEHRPVNIGLEVIDDYTTEYVPPLPTPSGRVTTIDVPDNINPPCNPGDDFIRAPIICEDVVVSTFNPDVGITLVENGVTTVIGIGEERVDYTPFVGGLPTDHPHLVLNDREAKCTALSEIEKTLKTATHPACTQSTAFSAPPISTPVMTVTDTLVEISTSTMTFVTTKVLTLTMSGNLTSLISTAVTKTTTSEFPITFTSTATIPLPTLISSAQTYTNYVNYKVPVTRWVVKRDTTSKGAGVGFPPNTKKTTVVKQTVKVGGGGTAVIIKPTPSPTGGKPTEVPVVTPKPRPPKKDDEMQIPPDGGSNQGDNSTGEDNPQKSSGNRVRGGFFLALSRWLPSFSH